MPNTIYLILTIAASIIGLLISAAALFGGVGYYRQGKDTQKSSTLTSNSDLIKFYKDEVNGYKEINVSLIKKMDDQKTDYTNQIHELSKELAEMRGRYGSIEKQKDEYLAILQNRDPAMTKFIEIMTKYIEVSTTDLAMIKQSSTNIESKLNEFISGGKIK